MRCAERVGVATVVWLLLASAHPSAEGLSPVHQTRYSMGTMFDIVAYHRSREAAERAIGMAMAEIVRLDHVMSNFKPESDLSRLNREGRHGFMAVETSLYEVIRRSLELSRLSGGRFDVTIAPVLRVWKQAHAEGRTPSADELRTARECVGPENVVMSEPDQVRYRRPCVEIDLGGIGKGYAVERAIALLRSEGIRHALVNAGGSSIGAIGAPPGRSGWPVHVGPDQAGGRSISTSQQNLLPDVIARGTFGDIIDPRIGSPVREHLAVSVVARSATLSDALSTALLMYSVDDARALLAHFPDASAIWMSPAGEHAHLP
jgi:thiamine biosynthesis lipoprotein